MHGIKTAAALLLVIVLFRILKKIINPRLPEQRVKEYIPRENIGKKTKVVVAVCIILVPFIIWFGITFLNARSNIFISLCIIITAMIPFFAAVEERNPPARELLIIAVMSAIAVVGRMAFFMIPQFKPMTAVVIISAIGLGPQAGFLTGTIAAFVSNFFFGQGPWTPWQMFCLGIIGFIAGLIFYKKVPFEERDKKWKRKRKIYLCIYGGLATFFIYGIIMDMSGILSLNSSITKEMIMSVLISGIPFNIIHAASTIIFLYIMAEPIEKKLDRVQKKFGI